MGSLRTLFTRKYDVVKAVDAVSFQIERQQDRLYRFQRRRQIDHDQSAHRHHAADCRQRPGGRLRSGSPEIRAGTAHRVVFWQRSQLWWDLPLLDSFRILRHIYQVPDAT